MSCVSPITIQTRMGPTTARCGGCVPCRIKRQSGLALRALFEARTSLSCDFWTLTYADAPEVLDYSDFSKFMKRYREWNRRQGATVRMRYLVCGEYGETSGRAHWHALIFNGLSQGQGHCHTKLWPHGSVFIGTVTPASVRYVTRYCLKESADRPAVANWSRDPALGEDGMRELARYMKNRGDKLEKAPLYLGIEGTKYPLDRKMREVFEEEFFGEIPKVRKEVAAAKSHLERRLDPTIEKVALSRYNRAKFWRGISVGKEASNPKAL